MILQVCFESKYDVIINQIPLRNQSSCLDNDMLKTKIKIINKTIRNLSVTFAKTSLSKNHSSQ